VAVEAAQNISRPMGNEHLNLRKPDTQDYVFIPNHGKGDIVKANLRLFRASLWAHEIHALAK
jgi:hypothetical protein